MRREERSAIRYYEPEKLVPAAHRHRGKRIYSESILDRLALIELAKERALSELGVALEEEVMFVGDRPKD